jgi:hypothetical protein|tara:strand:+ start:9700 stop:9951 length:252 start_codon:yes stop_codon:yes gene_type:complete
MNKHLPTVVYHFECFTLLDRVSYLMKSGFQWKFGEFITPMSKFCRDVLGYSTGDVVPAFEAGLKYDEYMKTHTMKELYKLKKC